MEKGFLIWQGAEQLCYAPRTREVVFDILWANFVQTVLEAEVCDAGLVLVPYQPEQCKGEKSASLSEATALWFIIMFAKNTRAAKLPSFFAVLYATF